MKNIKNYLIQMKDSSETMLDLAYAAIYLRDLNLVNQVDELFEKLKKIQDKIYKLCFRLEGVEEERLAIIDLTEQILGIAEKAKHLADIARAKVIPDIFKDIFKESDEKIFTEVVSKKSKLVNKKLSEIEIGPQIIGIKRKKKWIFDITSETKILPGDILVAVGNIYDEKLFKELLAGLS